MSKYQYFDSYCLRLLHASLCREKKRAGDIILNPEVNDDHVIKRSGPLRKSLSLQRGECKSTYFAYGYPMHIFPTASYTSSDGTFISTSEIFGDLTD